MEILTEKPSNKVNKSSSEIRTIAQMWEAAIEYYNDGKFDTEAMRAIYKRMNAKLSFQDIADVIYGVFADTYWVGIKMDSSILSKNMVQSLSLSSSQSDKYAVKAMKQWRGTLSRKTTGDTGQIPFGGSYSQSIDIVCNQDTQLDPSQLINNWNNEFWKTPQVGKNYIYVRVQNKGFKGELLAKAKMFYTTGGFNQPPSSWIQCLTVKDGNQEGEIFLSSDDPGVLGLGDRGASEAFQFNPKSQDHVCVIAAINDQFFTSNNPLGLSGSNWNSTTWIKCNGAAAWHNVNPQTSKVTSLKIHNQDGTSENFVLNAQCRNVPVGSKIKIETKDKRFLSEQVIISTTSQFIETEATLPGHYNGDLLVSLEDSKGNLLPSNAVVELTLYWKLEKGHKFYSKAAIAFDKTESLNDEQAIQTSLGSYTIRGAE